MSDDLRITKIERVMTLTLNRPHVMNATTPETWAKLLRAFQDVEHDDTIACVVINAEGPNFCSGQDVSYFAALASLPPRELAAELQRQVDCTNPLFLAMERIPQPVVASVRGMVAGGGISLVTFCDLVVGSETTLFLVAQIKLGVIPDISASYSLRRAIGLAKAKQYCLLGERMDASTAAGLGLLNWVVPDTELEGKTGAVVRQLVSTAPVALARTKSLLNRSTTNTLAQHMAEETAEVARCVMAPEFMESVARFGNRKQHA